MHIEIQLKISSANKVYLALNKMLSFRLLSKGTNEKLYTLFLRPIVMYACETWSTTQGDKENYSLLKGKPYGKCTHLFDFKMVIMRGEKNEDLERLFNKLNIRLFLKAKCLEWAVYIWQAVESFTRNVLIKNPPKKRPSGRPSQKWLDKIKKDI